MWTHSFAYLADWDWACWNLGVMMETDTSPGDISLTGLSLYTSGTQTLKGNAVTIRHTQKESKRHRDAHFEDRARGSKGKTCRWSELSKIQRPKLPPAGLSLSLFQRDPLHLCIPWICASPYSLCFSHKSYPWLSQKGWRRADN